MECVLHKIFIYAHKAFCLCECVSVFICCLLSSHVPFALLK